MYNSPIKCVSFYNSEPLNQTIFRISDQSQGCTMLLKNNKELQTSTSRDLPNPGIEPESPALQADSLPLIPLGISITVVLLSSFLQLHVAPLPLPRCPLAAREPGSAGLALAVTSPGSGGQTSLWCSNLPSIPSYFGERCTFQVSGFIVNLNPVQPPSTRLGGTSRSLCLLYWFHHSQSPGPLPGSPSSEQQARGPRV